MEKTLRIDQMNKHTNIAQRNQAPIYYKCFDKLPDLFIFTMNFMSRYFELLD